MPSLYELSQMEQDGTGDPVLDEAQRINESGVAVYDRIRKNPDLSDVAKRKQIAAAYTETQRRLAAHKASSDADEAARVTRLTRTAFGAPSDPIAGDVIPAGAANRGGHHGSTDRPREADRGAWPKVTTLMAQAIARHATDRRDRSSRACRRTRDGVASSTRTPQRTRTSLTR